MPVARVDVDALVHGVVQDHQVEVPVAGDVAELGVLRARPGAAERPAGEAAGPVVDVHLDPVLHHVEVEDGLDDVEVAVALEVDQVDAVAPAEGAERVLGGGEARVAVVGQDRPAPVGRGDEVDVAVAVDVPGRGVDRRLPGLDRRRPEVAPGGDHQPGRGDDHGVASVPTHRSSPRGRIP